MDNVNWNKLGDYEEAKVKKILNQLQSEDFDTDYEAGSLVSDLKQNNKLLQQVDAAETTKKMHDNLKAENHFMEKDYLNRLQNKIDEKDELASELKDTQNLAQNLGTATGALTGGGVGLGVGHLIDKKRNKEDARAGKVLGTIGGAGLGVGVGRHLTKSASDDKEKEKKKNIAGGLAAAGGAGALYKSAPKITGRERLYHGTDPSNVKNLLKDGIKAKFTGQEGSNTAALEGTDLYDKSLGKTFLTKSPLEGLMYASQSDLGGMSSGLTDEEVMANMPSARKGLLKANLPTWKDEIKTVENPEVAGMSFKEWKKNNLGPFERMNSSDKQLKNQYKGLKDRTVTVDGDIPSKYIKGSDNYQRANLGEIKEYAKKNPKKFGLGVGVGALGLAGLGYGGYRAYKHFKNKKEEDEDMNKEAFVQLGLEKIAADVYNMEDYKKSQKGVNPKDITNADPKKIGRNAGKQEMENQIKKQLPGLAGGVVGAGIGHMIDKKRDKEDARAGKILGTLGGIGLGTGVGRHLSKSASDKFTVIDGGNKNQKETLRSQLNKKEKLLDRAKSDRDAARKKITELSNQKETAELGAKMNKSEYDNLSSSYQNLGTATGALAGGGAGLGVGHLIDKKRNKEDAKAGKILGTLGGAGLGAGLGRHLTRR